MKHAHCRMWCCFAYAGILWWCCAAAAYAAPAYGTRMPEQGAFVAGVQSYSLLQRDLEHDQDMRSQQEFVLVSYGILKWLSLDLKGGLGGVRYRASGVEDRDYPAFLGGGYGFRAKIFARGPWRGVAGFQHISVHPYSINVGDRRHKAVLDDWQISALVSCACARFTPYAGGRWSRADYIHWVDNTRDRVRSDITRSYGLIAGCDIGLTRRMWVNVEASALDATAIAASINYAF